MAGRSGPADAEGRYEGIVYLPCTADNGFVPALPSRPVDLIYLCYPNNPTGAVMTRAQLRTWVDHARRTGAVIVYDAAYEAYIREPEIPHTIYEVEGAREVAIEIRSYSKTAGFTGTRLAFTVVPKECTGRAPDGSDVSLNALWRRRQSTKYNAAPYIIQKAGVALYTPEGQKQVREAVDFYMENARVIRDGVEAAGMQAYGGRNSPYVWLKTPPGLSSWDFFDKLLGEAHVVGTPGAGFGPCGEGYFRLTGFNSREATQEAVERIRTRLRL
jgi:LL-diaminopimelate aminotransferase